MAHSYLWESWIHELGGIIRLANERPEIWCLRGCVLCFYSCNPGHFTKFQACQLPPTLYSFHCLLLPTSKSYSVQVFGQSKSRRHSSPLLRAVPPALPFSPLGLQISTSAEGPWELKGHFQISQKDSVTSGRKQEYLKSVSIQHQKTNFRPLFFHWSFWS